MKVKIDILSWECVELHAHNGYGSNFRIILQWQFCYAQWMYVWIDFKIGGLQLGLTKDGMELHVVEEEHNISGHQVLITQDFKRL